MNNRGQAFSVFELMIAGVVAFAILIVLLMVIGGVNPFGTTQDAKTVIANGISGLSPSGDASTGIFEIKSRTGITNEDLTGKTGLDAKSILFATGQFGAGSNPNTSVKPVGEFGAGIQYTGSSSLKAQARIICKSTGAKLVAYMDTLEGMDKYLIDFPPTEQCGEEEFMPCCIVILERPSKQ